MGARFDVVYDIYMVSLVGSSETIRDVCMDGNGSSATMVVCFVPGKSFTTVTI
jgi:hypothetical protein